MSLYDVFGRQVLLSRRPLYEAIQIVPFDRVCTGRQVVEVAAVAVVGIVRGVVAVVVAVVLVVAVAVVAVVVAVAVAVVLKVAAAVAL